MLSEHYIREMKPSQIWTKVFITFSVRSSEVWESLMLTRKITNPDSNFPKSEFFLINMRKILSWKSVSHTSHLRCWWWSIPARIGGYRGWRQDSIVHATSNVSWHWFGLLLCFAVFLPWTLPKWWGWDYTVCVPWSNQDQWYLVESDWSPQFNYWASWWEQL